MPGNNNDIRPLHAGAYRHAHATPTRTRRATTAPSPPLHTPRPSTLMAAEGGVLFVALLKALMARHLVISTGVVDMHLYGMLSRVRDDVLCVVSHAVIVCLNLTGDDRRHAGMRGGRNNKTSRAKAAEQLNRVSMAAAGGTKSGVAGKLRLSR